MERANISSGRGTQVSCVPFFNRKWRMPSPRVCVASVKRSLLKVGGVTEADVSLERAQAVVSFDDAKTTVEALTEATTNVGYPSKLKK